MILDTLKYAESHEWVLVEGDVAIIGISDHAQHELGDIVFVELPDVGDEFSAGDVFGTVESVKTASDILSPVSGKVVEVNEVLNDSPETVNASPYGDAWMIKVQISDAKELDKLMDGAAYEKFISA